MGAQYTFNKIFTIFNWEGEDNEKVKRSHYHDYFRRFNK